MFEIVFHYPGEAFVPGHIQPDFSGEKQGGFGLFIVEQSVDDVVYDSPLPGICRIRLVKHMPASGAGESA
jgi:anti-sigma regulatory factor (Ser/Thr protein kinase)